MDYNSMAEMKKKHSARIAIFLLCWLAAEIAAFIGVAQLVGGFANAFWLIFGFSLLGYLALSLGRIKSFAGRAVCMLLIFPGFVTDVIAAIVAIKPLRSAIYARIMSKFLPPEMIQSFKNENGAKFSDFMRGMNGAGGAADFGARASKARGGGAGAVIDIDEGDGYEVKYSGRHDVVMQKKAPEAPKSLEAQEIIDVEHEWK